MHGDSAIQVKCTWSNTGNTVQALSMDEDDTADFVADSMDEEDHQVSLIPVILLWHQHDVLCYDSCKRGHVLKTMAVSFVGCCCSNVTFCSYTPDASLMTDQVQKSHARVLLACHASMHMLSLCCHIWCPPNLYMFLCSHVCCYIYVHGCYCLSCMAPPVCLQNLCHFHSPW